MSYSQPELAGGGILKQLRFSHIPRNDLDRAVPGLAHDLEGRSPVARSLGREPRRERVPGIGFWRVASVHHGPLDDPNRQGPLYGLPINVAFYTAAVVNTPAQVSSGIRTVRERLSELARSPVRRQAQIALDTIHLRNEYYRRAHPEHAYTRYHSELRR